LPAILLSGLFAIILHYAFTYVGLTMTDSSKTALLKQLATLLYICFGFLIVKDETFSVGKLVGGLVGFAGIALINSGSGSLQLGLGDWLIIAASVCAVISNLTIKQALKKSTPIMSTGVSHFFGGVGLAVGTAIMLVLIATNESVKGARSYLYPLLPFNGKALLSLIFRLKKRKNT
jgi:drug/metabolite transporter (DMT)-like permease